MGELIDAMLKNMAKINKEAQEPVKDSEVLSYVQRRADEIFSRSKDGAVPSYFDIEVREYNMQSLIKAINNPVFSTKYNARQLRIQSNGSSVIRITQKEL